MDIRLHDGVLVIRTADFDELNLVRKLPFRKFDPSQGAWVAEYVNETYEAAQMIGFDMSQFPPYPNKSASGVSVKGKNLVVRTPPTTENINLCRAFPDSRTWDKTNQVWVVKPTRRNLEHLRKHFAGIEFTEEALDLVQKTEAPFVQDKAALTDLIERATRDYKFGTTPYQHQLAAFSLGRDASAFAYFMEQGTGKTKVTIDNAGFLYAVNEINGVLVLCPKSVKSTWEEEVARHLPQDIPHRVLMWESGRVKTQHIDELPNDGSALCFFIMNVDAFSTGAGIECAERFCAKFDVMMVVDESSRIKNPSAKRTKACIKVGKMAKYRRILTGTPVTQSPLDLFSQFQFLDENILGFGSFYSFRNHFTIMGGWQNKQVLKYVHMSELQDTVAPYSYRVTKEECLDLPPTVYRKLVVELTPQQRKAYDEMLDDMSTTLNGAQVNTSLVLTQLLRLQQIVGGFLPVVRVQGEDFTQLIEPVTEAIPGGNPKVDALLDDLDGLTGKVLIWCRFRAEIDLIAKRLREEYGDDAVGEFHGGVTEKNRTVLRRAFQEREHPLRFLVLQVDTGGVGLTFTASDKAYYYSNSFSLESRLQSEARNHRAGSEIHEHVTYTDIIAAKTLDTKLLATLRKKLSLANVITGDNWREWI